jgi:hypothetical protein
MRSVIEPIINTNCAEKGFEGRTCTGRVVHRWSNAAAQSDMCSSRSCLGLCMQLLVIRLCLYINVSQSLQTSQLPENDRTSISLKEYLADIDVCMGGRVAEQLGAFTPTVLGELFNFSFDCFSVYGSENVTSGASSDIRRATRTAQAMVKVSHLSLFGTANNDNQNSSTGDSPAKLDQYSTKTGMKL